MRPVLCTEPENCRLHTPAPSAHLLHCQLLPLSTSMPSPRISYLGAHFLVPQRISHLLHRACRAASPILFACHHSRLLCTFDHMLHLACCAASPTLFACHHSRLLCSIDSMLHLHAGQQAQHSLPVITHAFCAALTPCCTCMLGSKPNILCLVITHTFCVALTSCCTCMLSSKPSILCLSSLTPFVQL